ncbi:MAG: PAS domain S-box protein [Pseudomonadota bacterium]|nr:PAS domain S-box protein [Pseudomonadota bacterium]
MDKKQERSETSPVSDHLEAIVDHAPTMMYIKNPAGDYIWANRKCLDSVSLTLSALEGKRDEYFFTPEIAQKMRDEDQEVLERQTPLAFELAMDFEGQKATFLTTKFPLYNEAGQRVAVGGISTDISERKRIEDGLRIIAVDLGGATGSELYQGLAREMAKLFDVDGVMIGVFTSKKHDTIKTLAVWHQDRWVDSFDFPLAGALAGHVTGKNAQLFHEGTESLFPAAVRSLLTDINSVLGVPLFDSARTPLGFVSLMSSKPITHVPEQDPLLRIFAGRIGVEVERNRTEKALYRSEQHLNLALEAGHIGTWEWDVAMNQLTWSRGIAAVMAFESPLPNSPESFLEKLHPDDREPMSASVYHSLKTGCAFHMEYRVVQSNRPIRWIEGRGKLYYDAEGNPQFLRGTVVDITKRKQDAEKLNEEKKLVESVLSSLPGAFYLFDRDGDMLRSNQQTASVTGFTIEELRTMKPLEFFAPKYRGAVSTAINKTFATGEGGVEAPLRTKDGREIPYYFNGKRIELEGRPFLVGVGIDISNRKQVEEKLQQYRTHLEELVEQRTTELTALNEELEAFSYSVSHDLRAPLRTIEGLSFALREDYEKQLDDKGRNYLNHILEASARMNELIDDLIKLSRVNRGELNRQMMDLSQLVSERSEEIRKNYPNHTVEIDITPGIQVMADWRLLRIAIDNLLDNAWKYTTTRDRGQITFSAVEKSGHRVFYIRDNGVGFDMQCAGNLFTPFQRLHDSQTFPGTGIGLATVKRVISRHGGDVWAEATPDGGATFCFTLGNGYPQESEAADTEH